VLAYAVVLLRSSIVSPPKASFEGGGRQRQLGQPCREPVVGGPTNKRGESRLKRMGVKHSVNCSRVTPLTGMRRVTLKHARAGALRWLAENLLGGDSTDDWPVLSNCIKAIENSALSQMAKLLHGEMEELLVTCRNNELALS
jgi:hypothetical protein